MYDREWARRILSTYKKTCPRAEQIDLCIIQLLASEGLSFTFTRAQIEAGLIRCIRDKHYSRTWYLYKKVCRETPFKVDRCRVLSRQIHMIYRIEADDARQVLLEFDFFSDDTT